jgi:hypothetical protein
LACVALREGVALACVALREAVALACVALREAAVLAILALRELGEGVALARIGEFVCKMAALPSCCVELVKLLVLLFCTRSVNAVASTCRTMNEMSLGDNGS